MKSLIIVLNMYEFAWIAGRFLLNSMGINFGLRHNNLKVGDVELPQWAESPKHFVETLKTALESDIVSSNLHNWIDLIFGYKQKGEEALRADNCKLFVSLKIFSVSLRFL